MNSRTVIVALVCLAVGAAAGIFGFIWLVGGDGTPSTTVAAPTLDINAVATLNPTQAWNNATQVAQLSAQADDQQATIEALSTQSAAQAQAVTDAESTAQAALQVAALAVEAIPTTAVEPTEVVPTTVPATTVPATTEPTAVVEPTTAAETTSAETSASVTERTLFRIDAASSQASFTLQEDLRGSRIDVVGTTSDVAGDIIIDYGNPAASQIGTVVISARTLTTPEEMRNRAIRSRILQSANDAYEFIQFVPTALEGLPETIAEGETYTFNITGDLTLVGQTLPVTFEATVTALSADQISGSATAEIDYTEWGIDIPSAPGVANVTPETTLAITFVANRVEA